MPQADNDPALLAEWRSLQAQARVLEGEHRRLEAASPRDTSALARLERAYTAVVRRRDFLGNCLGFLEPAR